MMEQTLIHCSIISLFLILCGFHSCPDFSVVSHSGKSVDLLGPGSGQFVEWINTCRVAYDQFYPLTGKVYIIRY